MLEKITKLKSQLDDHRPFSQDIIDNLEKWFEVELTYSSNAIEGNTLTRSETALVIEKGITVGGKPMKDHLEALNHRDALISMRKMINNKSITISDILYLHKLILKGIDDTNAGSIRQVPVRISGSTVVLPNPLKVPDLLEEFYNWLNVSQDHPVFKAAAAHYKFVTIHPFVDGNGRTGRLLMNLILMRSGYPPAIILPKDRLKYIKSLERAQLGGSLDDYLNVIYKAVLRSLNIYLKAINNDVPDQMLEPGDKLLKIGELANSTQETSSTIRYWTKIGLLEVVTTTVSGYQLYHPQMIERCKIIRELQGKRYTLEEIVQFVNKT